MNKEDWEKAEKMATALFGGVVLMIDGYRVTAKMERINAFTNALWVYVNGVFKGEWLSKDCEERRRFYRPVTRYLFPAKTRKLFSKRKHPEFHKKGTYWMPDWKSFKAMKTHFIKNNERIELIKEEGHVRDTG